MSRFLEDPERSGGHRKNPFRWGGGMDIFWNYTLNIKHHQEKQGFSLKLKEIQCIVIL